MIGATEKASRSDAIQLLHRHCSQAGTFLGAMLQRPVPSEFTTVWLLEPYSAVYTFTGARYLTTLASGYENIVLRLHRSETQASVGSTTLWRLEFDDGQSVPLCCSTDEELHIGHLTVLAATRKKSVWQAGRLCQIEAFDSDLVKMLLQYKSKPGVVAETIRVLRKLEHDKDRWLMSILWGRKPLRSFARLVERELTGQLP
jgi:hypothetical protein